MGISPRSVALQGIGFATLSVALQGWFAASQPAWVPTPAPGAQAALVRIVAAATDLSPVAEAAIPQPRADAAAFSVGAAATCSDCSTKALVACIEAISVAMELSSVASLQEPVATGTPLALGAALDSPPTTGAVFIETTAEEQT